MKEWHKNVIVGFVAIVGCISLIILFLYEPSLLFLLVILAVLALLFWLSYIIGSAIRESGWYECLVSYMKRMFRKMKGGE